MENFDLVKTLEAFCPKDTCGDPISTVGGGIYYTKRRMSFVGQSFTGKWIYRCPVCGSERKFRESFFGNVICEI